ncbi:hypothetical protein WJX82_002638 [Trebouxia sp. C0006]
MGSRARLANRIVPGLQLPLARDRVCDQSNNRLSAHTRRFLWSSLFYQNHLVQSCLHSTRSSIIRHACPPGTHCSAAQEASGSSLLRSLSCRGWDRQQTFCVGILHNLKGTNTPPLVFAAAIANRTVATV